MSKRRRDSNAVVAATAGQDSWRTWAGRETGSDEFEALDIFRGFTRKFKKKFVWTTPPGGTACPVCYTEPESAEQWHITSACGHAVCVDCLKLYAASQVKDPEHRGALKCPVCTLPLREKDAIVALKDNDEILRTWDAKIRDELLRALPNYRHCPHCSRTTSDNDDQPSSTGTSNNNSNTDRSEAISSSLTGGGFVTAECLAPINEERENQARKILDFIPVSSIFIMGLYFVYVYTYNTQIQSNSTFVNIFNTLAPLFLMNRLYLVGGLVLAKIARRALFRPVVVECPCCCKSFILNAEAELSADKNTLLGDAATQEFIDNNTRPCPSCSVPISKIDGCNHMKCSHCKASFCWACMRLRTFCAPYSCNNGAPFGNADTGVLANNNNGDNNNNGGGGGIAGRIIRIEEQAVTLNAADLGVSVLLLILSIVGRDSHPVQMIAKVFVTSFAVVFSSGFIHAVVFLFVVVSMLGRLGNNNINRQTETHYNHNIMHDDEGIRQHANNEDVVLFGRRQGRRRQQATEDEMIAQAIARSLREQ